MKPKTVGREIGQRPLARRNVAHSGFIQGAMILTLDGELPVEHLQAGDRVVTRDIGAARLKAVTQRDIRLCPISVKPGTLGQSRPKGEVLMLPGQMVLLRDWRARAFGTAQESLVELSKLVDGEFILSSNTRQTLRVYDLQFEDTHVIYADGIESASGTALTRRQPVPA